MAKYGKVNGPYFDNGIPVGVRISEYDDSGNLISKKSVGYKKYLAGVEKGEFQYLEPPHLRKRPTVITTYHPDLKPRITRLCLKCEEPFPINTGNKHRVFCSVVCGKAFRKNKAAPKYCRAGYVVIPIRSSSAKNSEVSHFIVVDMKNKRDGMLLIRKSDVTDTVKTDINGVLHLTINFDSSKGLRVRKPRSHGKLFLVTDSGILISRRSKSILSMTLSATGYMTHASKIGGRRGTPICVKIHRLVAEAFVDNPLNKPFVNHLDGVKTNNHFSNLEWCDSSENVRRAYDTGLIARKSAYSNHASKMTPVKMAHLHALVADGSKSLAGMARELGVSKRTVFDIVKGKSYIGYGPRSTSY